MKIYKIRFSQCRCVWLWIGASFRFFLFIAISMHESRLNLTIKIKSDIKWWNEWTQTTKRMEQIKRNRRKKRKFDSQDLLLRSANVKIQYILHDILFWCFICHQMHRRNSASNRKIKQRRRFDNGFMLTLNGRRKCIV